MVFEEQMACVAFVMSYNPEKACLREINRDLSVKNVEFPSLSANEEEGVVFLLRNLSLLLRFVCKVSNIT